MNRVTRIVGAMATAGAFLAMVPSADAASCSSSTPSRVSYADAFDGEAGLAPEISTVRANVDANCTYSVDPGLTAPLLADDSVFIYIDTDGNPSTGSALFGGADVAIGTLGQIGADTPPMRGVWDGTSFSFDDATPVGPALSTGGFSATVDRLEIDPGTTTRFMVGTLFQGIYDSYSDYAPSVGLGSILLPVDFSTRAPLPAVPVVPVVPAPTSTYVPPAPSTPAPGVTRTIPTGAASGADDVTCVVPFTTRLTPTKAYRRIKRLGCATASAPGRAYSATVKPGRVIRTTPTVGTQTSRPVRLVISRGKRPGRRLAGIDTTLQRLTADAALAQREAEHRP